MEIVGRGKDDQGVTAIHFASFKGNVKIIKLLIENGADIFIKTKRLLNIIHYSAQGNKPSSIMFYYFELMKKGDFQLIKDKDSGGSTPLHWAAYSNAEDALLYLINLNIFKNEKEKLDFINMKDYQDFTPLHLSVTSKSSRIVMKLLQNGASPEIKNKNQMTPLDLAIKKEQKEIIEIIRNNQSCQICNFKAPVRQIKKSPKNDNVNNNGLFNIFNDNNEDKKVNNSEDLNKKDNIYNNKNLEVSGIKGAFNRRKPFSSIKF